MLQFDQDKQAMRRGNMLAVRGLLGALCVAGVASFSVPAPALSRGALGASCRPQASGVCMLSPSAGQPPALGASRLVLSAPGLHAASPAAGSRRGLRIVQRAPLVSSGGGGSRGGNTGRRGGGGDDNEGEGESGKLPAEIIAILGADGKLPEELAAAVAAGRIGGKEVANWLNLQKNPLLSWIASISDPMKVRLIADARFFVTLGIELAVGCAMKMIAEVQQRSKRNAFWKELDFVASDMALEFLGDFALVFLLCPVAQIAPPATKGVAAALGKLPSFFLQAGGYTAQQRAACFAYKAMMFWCVGFFTSVAGHSVTKTLIEARSGSTGHMAPVLDNSVQWGNFMGVSSNLRYQLLSSFEARLMPRLFPGFWVQSAVSTSLRLANCFSGGVQWLMWARIMGLQ